MFEFCLQLFLIIVLLALVYGLLLHHAYCTYVAKMILFQYLRA